MCCFPIFQSLQVFMIRLHTCGTLYMKEQSIDIRRLPKKFAIALIGSSMSLPIWDLMVTSSSYRTSYVQHAPWMSAWVRGEVREPGLLSRIVLPLPTLIRYITIFFLNAS